MVGKEAGVIATFWTSALTGQGSVASQGPGDVWRRRGPMLFGYLRGTSSLLVSLRVWGARVPVSDLLSCKPSVRHAHQVLAYL